MANGAVMSITLTIDAVVLCFTLAVAVGGGFVIKWWKDDKK